MPSNVKAERCVLFRFSFLKFFIAANTTSTMNCCCCECRNSKDHLTTYKKVKVKNINISGSYVSSCIWKAYKTYMQYCQGPCLWPASHTGWEPAASVDVPTATVDPSLQTVSRRHHISERNSSSLTQNSIYWGRHQGTISLTLLRDPKPVLFSL